MPINEIYPKVPPEQTTYLEAFSPNTADNICKINQVHSPSFVGDSMSNEMEKVTGVCADTGNNDTFPSDDSRILPPLYIYKDRAMHYTVVSISPGNCLVNNIFIEILGKTNLDLTYSSSYVNGKKFPELEGTTYVYAVVYYNPTRNTQEAYVGFLNQTSFLNPDIRKYCCLLGMVQLEVNVTGDIQNIVNDDYFYITHPTEDINRQEIWQWETLDGGFIGSSNLSPWPASPLMSWFNYIDFDGSGLSEEDKEVGKFFDETALSESIRYKHTRNAYVTSTNVIGGKAYNFTLTFTTEPDPAILSYPLYVQVEFVPYEKYSKVKGTYSWEYEMGFDWADRADSIEHPTDMTYVNGVETTITGNIVIPEDVNDKLVIAINNKVIKNYYAMTWAKMNISAMSLTEVTN
jgi:hypothetical protein